MGWVFNITELNFDRFIEHVKRDIIYSVFLIIELASHG